MNSIILRTAVRFVTPIMLLFAALLLVRGHNEPGGGFIGGLIAATGLIVQTITAGPGAARRLVHMPPSVLIAAGLLVALLSALPGFFLHGTLFASVWIHALHVGTPLLFDVGVFMVVIGTVLIVIEAFAEGDA